MDNKDKKKGPKKQKKPQDRSPRYPSISFREAVSKVKLLYEKEKRAFVPREVAVTAWGYNKLHGRSLTMLASVAQYGLLKRQSKSVGISDDAFVILEAPRHKLERKEALKRCSETPSIFDELLQQHAGCLPSDDTLKWDLKQRSFTDQAVKTVIGCLRDTISFVNEETKDYNGGNDSDYEENIVTTETQPMPVIAEKPRNMGGITWNFPLLGKIAQVSISGGEPVQEDVDLLTKLLEAFKLGLGKRKPENNADNEE